MKFFSRGGGWKCFHLWIFMNDVSIASSRRASGTEDDTVGPPTFGRHTRRRPLKRPTLTSECLPTLQPLSS